MADQRSVDVVHLDHHSPEFAANVEGIWKEMREKCPVAWSDAYDGFWVVTDMQGNHEILKNDEVFSSQRYTEWGGEGMGIMIPKIPGPYRALPNEVDRPEHRTYRAWLNKISSPRAAEEMRPRVEFWVQACLDRIIESGEGDLVHDLASPVPAYVTLEWLGYPLEHARLASDAYHDLLGMPPGSEGLVRAIAGRDRMMEIVAETLAARRLDPKDDIISYFIEQEVDGEPADDWTILEMLLTLVGGGVDSTTSLTASALVHLHHDHELRQRLIDEPELLDSATEEFLRMYAPFNSIARTVVKETEYRGCPMKVGDRLLLSRHAANYDEKVFDKPQEFVPDRFPNPHTSFGLGPHRCSGSHLARLMFQTMIKAVLTRIPDYDLDDDVMERYPDRGFVHGWISAPAKFTPGTPIGSPHELDKWEGPREAH